MIYTQPAAANYHSPPMHMHKQRGHRLCDQCGVTETPYVPKFRLCSGCLTTQYCSHDCQKAHWPAHKAICQHTTQQIATTRQPTTRGYPDESLAKGLRKFASAHNALITWMGYQALQIKRLPANARQNALLIELSHRSGPADSSRLFTISSTHIVPRSYIRDSLVLSEIQTRDSRCRQKGGLGALVVILQCAGVSQVMPVEVDHPSTISWDSREDWEHVARHFVESGRTDFKPISTTARGIYYG